MPRCPRERCKRKEKLTCAELTCKIPFYLILQQSHMIGVPDPSVQFENRVTRAEKCFPTFSTSWYTRKTFVFFLQHSWANV